MLKDENDADINILSDPEYRKLQIKLNDVVIEETIEDEIRSIFN